MNLILHKAASILVYRYYSACNIWFLKDYSDNLDIINSRTVINRVIEIIDETLEGDGLLKDISKDDLIDFKDNLEKKIRFANELCGIEEYSDIVLDELGDTVYRYCMKDKHWDPVPMLWMTVLTPNEQYELGSGLHDLVVEYNAYRDAKRVTQGKVDDGFEPTAYAVTTEITFDSELANEVRELSKRFYSQVTDRRRYIIDDNGSNFSDSYWNDVVSTWYEMDTIIDELSSMDSLDAEMSTCIEELRFNKFSIQAENDIWISYKPDSERRTINIAYKGDGNYKEVQINELTFSTSGFANN